MDLSRMLHAQVLQDLLRFRELLHPASGQFGYIHLAKFDCQFCRTNPFGKLLKFRR